MFLVFQTINNFYWKDFQCETDIRADRFLVFAIKAVSPRQFIDRAMDVRQEPHEK